VLSILIKLLLTIGTFFPVYVTVLLTASNQISNGMWANHLKIDRKLARYLAGMDFGIFNRQGFEANAPKHHTLDFGRDY
jgi:hypothetical protein